MLLYGKDAHGTRCFFVTAQRLGFGVGFQSLTRNLSVTPRKARGLRAEEVRKICLDYTLIGLQCMMKVANPDHSFRFIYKSGSMTERDQSKTLWLSNEYRKMKVIPSTNSLSGPQRQGRFHHRLNRKIGRRRKPNPRLRFQL